MWKEREIWELTSFSGEKYREDMDEEVALQITALQKLFMEW